MILLSIDYKTIKNAKNLIDIFLVNPVPLQLVFKFCITMDTGDDGNKLQEFICCNLKKEYKNYMGCSIIDACLLIADEALQ